jgi:hypothetical protein
MFGFLGLKEFTHAFVQTLIILMLDYRSSLGILFFALISFSSCAEQNRRM